MNQTRSTIALENIEEVLAAETSPKWATLAGQQQYFTPNELRDYCVSHLRTKSPVTVIDPQCGEGALVKGLGGWGTTRYGIDIDNRIEGEDIKLITGNFMKVWEVIKDLSGIYNMRWAMGNANPPFGKRWKDDDGKMIDSTDATWKFLTEHCNTGYFISNHKTIERLGIDKHPWVYKYETKASVWNQCEVVVGIVWYENSAKSSATHYHELNTAWERVKEIIDEEATNRPKFNIYLDRAGYLQTYLSVRTTVKRRIGRDEILRLHRVKDCHPLTLTTEKETRDLMKELVGCGLYTIEPAAKSAIEQALADVHKVQCPIMPVTDFERVAYADEEEHLECHTTVHNDKMHFTAGMKYPVVTGTYTFRTVFKRNKVHWNEESKTMFTKEHECSLSGSDRYIAICDDNEKPCKFMDKAGQDEFDESFLWMIFKKPEVRTVVELFPDRYEQNLSILKSCEMLAGYNYYAGQTPYLARVASKDYGLVAGATGCHEKGAMILLADGSVKKVEDVRVGDELQGWDGTPRRVLELRRGQDEMMRIVPTKGEPFVVNINHILTLVRTNKSRNEASKATVIDVSVKDWLSWNTTQKHIHKLFRVPVQWPEVRQPITPYFLGLLLGDGFLKEGQLSFSKPDPETEQFVRLHSRRNGWGIRKSQRGPGNPTFHFTKCDSLRRSLFRLGLAGKHSGNKFIPEVFKVCSINQRLEVLAGLMDTDGSLSCGGYDYISKSRQLAEDVAFVARSVGLAAYIKPCVKSCQGGFCGTYYRVSISGNCNMIPCRIARRKAPVRKQKKDVLRTGFKVERLGRDDYYGFTITGDGRYVMGDFTVTHNTGKTLMAISLLAMKGPKRALIVAPQGTMRSSEMGEEEDEESQEYNASQWVSEIAQFAPFLQIWEIFCLEDYQRIKAQNGGELPSGVYVTYYQAMFQNGARESAADKWDDEKLNAMFPDEGYAKLPLIEGRGNEAHWCNTIGKEHHGIRCVLQPSLSTIIGHEFDMVMLDEAHLCTNLSANVTQIMIRLQPRYRYALTATPIPNIVSNLFSLCGWLAVSHWFMGNRRNAAWPYARHELGRFNETFLSEERDETQEQMNRAADKKWKGKCVKTSPIISSPARLLKLLKPIMAYISKKECNPNYQDAKVIDVRVPMGVEQSRLYGHFLNRSNVPGRHPLIRARRQTAYLRAICADPAGFEKSPPGMKVKSNMNPKTVAIMELVREIMGQGEQVVIISARVGQTDTLMRLLTEAGVKVSRIDSKVPASQHSYQANLFKKGKTQVMLMGIKCAAAHSFSQCKYEIIGSLEYSNGPLDQAKGRVDRVNSRPGVTIYVILHARSIEETQFDVVATKQDAATICLMGKRVPRGFKPVDMSEVLANSISRFDVSGASPESECELAWPKLRSAIKDSLLVTTAQ
ncbi:Hint domain-containing homing endonuclease [Pedosphaera parvula]|nr:Hint domain-containing homing endonuclease [Pedosphaera parvula]